MKKALSLLFLIAFQSVAHAGDLDFSFTIKTGEPYRIDFQDGRVAIISTKHTHNKAKLNAVIQESQCYPKAKSVRCEYPNLEFDFLQHSLVWEKHPNASKIGMAVVYSAKSNSFGLNTTQNIDLEEAYTSQDPIVKRTPIQLSCPDFTWLAGTVEAPSQIIVPIMSSANMSKNIETGDSMNQLDDGLKESVWKSVGPTIIEMSGFNYNSGFRMTSRTARFVGGLDALWVLQNPEGEACQIRMGLSISSLDTDDTTEVYNAGDSPAVDKSLKNMIQNLETQRKNDANKEAVAQ
jgi:hypothetical protein